MTHHDFVSVNNRNTGIWFLLAFQAGAVNAGGFLACHRFVTHTTGFATHFGVEYAQKHFASALSMLTVPIFFIFGAMISAYFVDIPFQSERPPNYRVPVTLITVIMIIATIGGQLGWYGEFDAPYVVSRDYGLLALLTLAMGLQNSLLCNAHGATVRTTHLTGLSTDLAVGLTRLIFHRHPKLKNMERRYVFARFGTIFCFILGSILSAYVFIKMRYLGFWVPTLTSFVLWKFAFR